MIALPKHWKIHAAALEDKRWPLIERIVGSAEFHKAPQLRDILTYIAARSLQDPSANISEHEIGVVVLKRGPDFHPASDNIVRAQVRHLRMKLQSYYSGEGRNETTIITIPKGHYVAQFDRRPPVATNKASAPLPTPAAPSRWNSRGNLGLTLVLVAAIVAVPFLWSALRSPSEPLPREYRLYEDVLGPGRGDTDRETWLVLTNPHTMLYGEPGTSNGISPAHPQDQIRQRGFSPGLTYAAGSFQLGRLMQILERQVGVTESRFLNWTSARRRDLIILGSPGPGEWVSENAPEHNFTIVPGGIRNQSPRPGEQELYPLILDESGMAVTDHGLLWSWQSQDGTRVLVLAGASPAATGAVAVLFSEPSEFGEVYERLKGDVGEEPLPPNWQALVRVHLRDNSPLRAEYLVHRIYP